MYYLEANHIVKQYASHRALDNVTVHVPRKRHLRLIRPKWSRENNVNPHYQPNYSTRRRRSFNKRASFTPLRCGTHRLPTRKNVDSTKKMKVGEQILYLAQLKGLSKNDAKEGMKYWLNKFDIKGWEKRKNRRTLKRYATEDTIYHYRYA